MPTLAPTRCTLIDSSPTRYRLPLLAKILGIRGGVIVAGYTCLDIVTHLGAHKIAQSSTADMPGLSIESLALVAINDQIATCSKELEIVTASFDSRLGQ
jgi:hypothetical protein